MGDDDNEHEEEVQNRVRQELGFNADDLFKDESDQTRIEALNELERENILQDRQQKVEDAEEKHRILFK